MVKYDEKAVEHQNLTTLLPLPKCITDEFPGGVINFAVCAGSDTIVDPIYSSTPIYPKFN